MHQPIILLNGPSGSGKSTLSRALKDIIGGECIIVSIDDFLPMSADEPVFEDDVYEIMPALCRYLSDALSCCAAVIIDHVITSQRIFDALMHCCCPDTVFMVHVTCSPEIPEAREAARKNRCPGSAAASAQYLYPKRGYHLTVNTGTASPRECADAIFRALYHTNRQKRS